MKAEVLSFDLCGTLDDCSVYNDMWYEIIPKMYAEKEGVELKEAKSFVMSSYKEVGPMRLEWYLPSFWIKKFGLDYDRFLNESSRIKVRVPEELKKLRGKYRLILSTNVSKEVLSFSLVDNIFDEVYSSVDLGLPKKDERFWKLVLKNEKVSPFEIVHIGDDYVYDYLVPASLGLRANYASLKSLRLALSLAGVRL